MSNLKMPWKKNFRRMPEWVLRRVRESDNNNLIVSCVKKISPAGIAAGTYNHLGLERATDAPTSTPKILPDANVGRYSNWNANGRVVIRRDLPKIRKNFGPYEVPIYGDPSRGYCDVIIPRMVYQRDFIAPTRWEIETQFLDREPGTGDLVFRFEITARLNRTTTTFDADLFFALNLLQENVGAVNVFSASATQAEFLGTVLVNWEILPPGEDARQRILSSFSRSTAEIQERVNTRLEMLTTLSPIAFINGTNGFDRYFGAKFSDRLVVFENVSYGNAAYAMNEAWQLLSQLPRIELLRQRPDGFTRFVHADGWENRLRSFVDENR
jgi:hypothetical protein